MLRVEALTKRYEPPHGLLRMLVRTAHDQPIDALRGIDFSIDPGEIVGVVGPNGAGKSTLIRLCATLLTPTSGRVEVDGVDVAVDPHHARRALGLLLTDERALYWRLTGRENLRFFGVMAGLAPAVARERADRLLAEFELDDRRVFGYSSGMRVRLGLARALIADPRLLLLDEPSRSLDPIATARFHERLREIAASGTAILLSSHRLDEVEAICDRVLVVLGGRQRAWMSTDELHRAGSVAGELRRLLDPEEGAP